MIRVFHRSLTPVVVIAAILGCSRWSLALAPDTPGAVDYHPRDATAHLTAAERELARDVSELFDAGHAPKLDPWLVDAARRLAARAQPVRDVLVAAGVSDAFAIPVRFGLDRTRPPLEPVADLIRRELPKAHVTHFGVGSTVVDGSPVAAIVFVRRGAEIGHFPKRFMLGDRALVNGRLNPELHDPRLLVATPLGDIYELEPRFVRGVFWSHVQFSAGTGRYIVELQARDGYGVQVLNLLEVWVGSEAARLDVVRVRPEVAPPETITEAEMRAARLINATRRRKHLPPLRIDTRLSREARRHARDMAENGFFGHDSPLRGSLATRLEASRESVALALENIAIGASPEATHAELLRSPSHLRNILDPEVTELGVGTWRRDGGPQPVFTFAHIFVKRP